jgi:hypothetical protein
VRKLFLDSESCSEVVFAVAAAAPRTSRATRFVARAPARRVDEAPEPGFRRLVRRHVHPFKRRSDERRCLAESTREAKEV